MRVLLIGWLLVCGCSRTYIRRASSVGPDDPLPTLLLHASVSHERDASEDVRAHTTVDALAQELEIQAFGETVMDALTPVLAQHGIELQIDPDRAQKVHEIDWTDAWSVRMAPLWDSLTLISTAWVDTRGAQIGGLTPHHLFRRTEYSRIAQSLNPDGRREGYLFAVVRVTSESRWLFIRAPEIRVNLFVADAQGREILNAQSVGRGQSRFLVVDRSQGNLLRGLNKAMDGLERAPVRRLGVAQRKCVASGQSRRYPAATK